MKIKGTSALVTGAGSGLGEATARYLAEQGAKVVLIDLDIDKAQQVASQINGLAIQADVSSPEQVTAALDKTETTQGAPRIVVNCAGIAPAGRVVGRDGPLSLEDYERVITVNLIGTFNVMRLTAHRMTALDPLEDDERGSIVNTASVAAFDGQIGQAAYAASKGGIVSMTLPVAREFSRFGIRVNCIAPGIFMTPLLQGMPEEVQVSLAADIPFPQRLGDPAEFADAVRFCIENQYLNAETIRLDGAVRLKER